MRYFQGVFALCNKDQSLHFSLFALAHTIICFLQVLYQRPGSSRVLISILVNLRTVLFWTEISNVDSGICWNHSFSMVVTTLSGPMGTGTPETLTLHSFSISSFSPWYFFSFKSSFFLMLESEYFFVSLSSSKSLNDAYNFAYTGTFYHKLWFSCLYCKRQQVNLIKNEM